MTEREIPPYQQGGMNQRGYLRGWGEICEYIGMSKYMAKRLRYPVYQMSDPRQVWAIREELDAHMPRLLALCEKRGAKGDEPD